jgi:hypothetical protein
VGCSRPEGRYQAAGIGGRASIPPEVLGPVRRQCRVDIIRVTNRAQALMITIGIMAAQQIPLLCT